METSCTYTDATMFLSTDERWLINRILRFQTKHPQNVQVLRMPQDNDGCLYCKLPSNWLKITPPAKRELTDEQRIAAGSRLQKSRQNKLKSNNVVQEGDVE